MRILDRYLLRQLLVPFFYCMVMFLLLWVLYDLLGDNLPDFVAYKSKFKEVVAYYLIVMPRTVVDVLPLALILSLLYCLSTLSRHNELTAMRASGIGVTRLMAPCLLVGLACAALVFVLSETVVPRSLVKAENFMSWQKNRRFRVPQSIRPFSFYNRVAHREWLADEFKPHTGELISPKVMVRSSANKPLRYYTAEKAVWHDDAWWFINLDIFEYDELGQSGKFLCRTVAQQRMEEFNETPKLMARSASAHAIRPFFYINRPMHREWLADEFKPDIGELSRVNVMVRSPDGTPQHYYRAESAVWRDGVWWFFGVLSVDYDETGHPVAVRRTPVPQQRMDGFNELPEVMRRAAELYKPSHMSLGELRRRIDDPVNPPSPSALRQLRMAYHDRYAFPWMCVVVILLGVPFGITSDRRGAFLGVANSLALFFAYYFIVNIDRALCHNGYLNPILAAWLPNVTFAAVGLFFLARLR